MLKHTNSSRKVRFAIASSFQLYFRDKFTNSVSELYRENWCSFRLSKYVFPHVVLRGSLQYSNICPTRCNFTQFILSGNCSTCFGWYHHPSLGAQTTVSTA